VAAPLTGGSRLNSILDDLRDFSGEEESLSVRAVTMQGAPVAELGGRRARVLARLPGDALVLVRGALPTPAMRRFRQSNDLYYLAGIEVPGAYLLVDARAGETTLYLPHRDARRERSDGPTIACEDDELVRERSGVDRVAGPERLPSDLGHKLFRGPRPVYVPLAPEEGEATSRDSALAAAAWAAADPFGVGASVEGAFAAALRRSFPQLDVRDLSPLLDAERLQKSAHEIELLREAARLCALAVMEAMRSTAPGVHEYELEAIADFVFRQGGARGAGYEAIIAGGSNAWYGHYNANDAELLDGDLMLMDYAPDVGYYTSDIGRMWPVNGRYSDRQRELYGFVVDYHRELVTRIRPGVTQESILADAADAMRARADAANFSSAAYAAAAQAALTFDGHLSHPVGMAVHDVGDYSGRPLEPGLVFSVDPMIWVEEEKLYVRVEDTVVVTDDGVENLTGLVPLELDDVEALMSEPGLLQWWKERA
jgi:Xaa-Pro aminopeptidase